MKLTNEIELNPDNFCYLSKCSNFISDINSTGCMIDYLEDGQEELLDKAVCPLEMEKQMRSDDPVWVPTKKEMMDDLKDMNDSFKSCKRAMNEMGADKYMEAMGACMELEQEVFDAKIKYEQLQYQLQEIKDRCFGQFEEKRK